MTFRRKKSRKKFILIAILAVLVGVFWYFKFYELKEPQIFIADAIYTNHTQAVPLRVSDEGSGLFSVKATLKKENESYELIEKLEKGEKIELIRELKIPDFVKPDEDWVLEITAVDKSVFNFIAGKKGFKRVKVIADTQKPIVSVIANSRQIDRGGAAGVVFRASDEHLDEIFIETHNGKGEKRRFEVLPFMDEKHFASLVAWDSGEDDYFRAYIVARDRAGNATREQIRFYLSPLKYKKSQLALKDGFLDGKIEELARQYANPTLSRLEKFKFINETLRQSNEDLIHSLAKTPTGADFAGISLKKFTPLKRAKKVGHFADHRFYSYKKDFVSESRHLGIDLASIARDDIFSSLDGRVVFADENGIYGINILIDHGYGLFSLYAHCSSKLVSPGDFVKAGAVIAKTGTSGLALGDHLHFGVLVQGIEVRPEQFQDERWLKEHLLSVFESAKKLIKEAK